jgi:hypothetical protein
MNREGIEGSTMRQIEREGGREGERARERARRRKSKGREGETCESDDEPSTNLRRGAWVHKEEHRGLHIVNSTSSNCHPRLDTISITSQSLTRKETSKRHISITHHQKLAKHLSNLKPPHAWPVHQEEEAQPLHGHSLLLAIKVPIGRPLLLLYAQVASLIAGGSKVTHKNTRRTVMHATYTAFSPTVAF